jgi:hypothetical protein
MRCCRLGACATGCDGVYRESADLRSLRIGAEDQRRPAHSGKRRAFVRRAPLAIGGGSGYRRGDITLPGTITASGLLRLGAVAPGDRSVGRAGPRAYEEARAKLLIVFSVCAPFSVKQGTGGAAKSRAGSALCRERAAARRHHSSWSRSRAASSSSASPSACSAGGSMCGSTFASKPSLHGVTRCSML